MTAPAPVSVRFEFNYTTIATNAPTSFALGGITEEVAHGIRVGLEGVASITNVTAVEVMETREAVSVPVAE
jgi:hypothetical protein